MRMIRHAGSIIGLATALLAPASVYAQVSPLDDMLKAATKALEVFNYRQADSISRTVLAFGSALTKQQRALALQVSIAAIYPEDKPNERQTDTARTRIKQLLAVDPAAWDRNLTWDGLDTLRAIVVRASGPGKIVLGSRTPNAFLFIGDQPQGLLGSVRTIDVPPDVDVRLAIRADKCVPFDTVVRVRAADTLVVGRRNLTCTP